MQQQAQQWPQCDSAARQRVEQMVHILQGQLGENLAGVYLYGSLAFGSYYPPKSSVDIFALTTGPLPCAAAEGLQEDLVRLAASQAPEVALACGILTAAEACRPLAPLAWQFCFDTRSDTPEPLPPAEKGGNSLEALGFAPGLPLRLAAVQQHGLALLGPPATEAFAAPEHELVLLDILETSGSLLWENDLPEQPQNAILNACRLLHMRREANRRIGGKEESGEWALKKLPGRLRPLVLNALLAYRSNEADSSGEVNERPRRWDPDDLESFQKYARRKFTRMRRPLLKKYDLEYK